MRSANRKPMRGKCLRPGVCSCRDCGFNYDFEDRAFEKREARKEIDQQLADKQEETE